MFETLNFLSCNSFIADLSDPRINCAVNRGYGLFPDGTFNTKDSIKFETVVSDENIYPMFVVDFIDYLSAYDIPVERVQYIDLLCSIFDADDNEIDINGEYEKFAFVSQDKLDGYSNSDILTGAYDYLAFNNKVPVRIDLTEFTGYKDDGITLTEHVLEDGAGINIQLINGNFQDISYLELKYLAFTIDEFPEKGYLDPDALYKRYLNSLGNAVVEDIKREVTRHKGLSEILDENNILHFDLTDDRLKAYINIGAGLTSKDVSFTEAGITFAGDSTQWDIFPMFAVDISRYLAAYEINMSNVAYIDIVAIAYNDAGDEIDLSTNFQKCSFVSKDAFNGYSPSDILPIANYKLIGSKEVTRFDLSTYTGLRGDGVTTADKTVADGIGFNIQLTNGDLSSIKFFVISNISVKLM